MPQQTLRLALSTLMRSWLLLLGIFAMVSTTLAQRSVTVAGRIVDDQTGLPVPLAHIINTTRSTGAYSNDAGQFRFQMVLTDTLVISAVGYQLRRLTLAGYSSEDLGQLTLRLTQAIKELDPVTITGYNIQEIIEKSRQKEVNVVGPKKEYPTRTEEEMRIKAKPQLGPGGLYGGLEAIAWQFNSRYKQQKKLDKIREEDNERQRQEAIIAYYTDVAAYVLNIPDSELARFVQITIPPLYQIEEADDYDLILYILKRYEALQRASGKKKEFDLSELLEKGRFRVEDN
jgi:hypothetical protein